MPFGDQAARLQGEITVTYPDDGTEVGLDVGIIAIGTDDLVTVPTGVAAGQTLDVDLVGHLAKIIADRQGG